MGQVFYRDWTPGSFQDPTYNSNGAELNIESWKTYTKPDLPLQPISYYDNRLGVPEFYLANIQDDYTVAIRDDAYPESNDLYYFSPAQPIRYDVYSQLVQKTSGQAVAGNAPTRGIYTGLNDLGYE